MLDIGWSELILIGIVALIVVGPKDLPRMFHALGRMTGKARNMAREFQRAMDDAAKATGLDEVRKDLNDIRDSTSPRKLGIDALENAASKFEKWDPKSVLKPAAAPATPVVTTGNPTLAAVTTTTTAAAPATGEAAEAAAPALGPETAALAEKKAAEQAAARQRALELQAERTQAAARKFAEKASETAAAETAKAVAPDPAPASTVASAPEGREPVAGAAPKPARKPPVRKKKSDA